MVTILDEVFEVTSEVVLWFVQQFVQQFSVFTDWGYKVEEMHTVSGSPVEGLAVKTEAGELVGTVFVMPLNSLKCRVAVSYYDWDDVYDPDYSTLRNPLEPIWARANAMAALVIQLRKTIQTPSTPEPRVRPQPEPPRTMLAYSLADFLHLQEKANGQGEPTAIPGPGAEVFYPPMLLNVGHMKTFYPGYNVEEAKTLIDHLEPAYTLSNTTGKKWSVTNFASEAGMERESASRYINAFKRAGINEIRGVPLPGPGPRKTG